MSDSENDEPQFTELDTQAAAYEFEGGSYPQEIPAKAKSRFAEEHDVDYRSCYASLVYSGNERFVIVGEIDE